MTFAEQIRVNRWAKMAQADLGSLIEPMAIDLTEFFTRAAASRQFSVKDLTTLHSVLCGYAINHSDDLAYDECLDICTVTIKSSFFIEDFEDFLMYEYTFAHGRQGWADLYRSTFAA